MEVSIRACLFYFFYSVFVIYPPGAGHTVTESPPGADIGNDIYRVLTLIKLIPGK